MNKTSYFMLKLHQIWKKKFFKSFKYCHTKKSFVKNDAFYKKNNPFIFPPEGESVNLYLRIFLNYQNKIIFFWANRRQHKDINIKTYWFSERDFKLFFI